MSQDIEGVFPIVLRLLLASRNLERGSIALRHLEFKLTTSTAFCIRWSTVSTCSLCTVIDEESSEEEEKVCTAVQYNEYITLSKAMRNADVVSV